MRAHRWLWVLAWVASAAVGCDKKADKTPPKATSDTAASSAHMPSRASANPRPATAATATTSGGTASSSVSANAAAAAADQAACKKIERELAKAVEGAASCTDSGQCRLRRLTLCRVAGLDCYDAHVNKEHATSEIDKAVEAYQKSCPILKCKCTGAERSVCIDGRCRKPKAPR